MWRSHWERKELTGTYISESTILKICCLRMMSKWVLLILNLKRICFRLEQNSWKKENMWVHTYITTKLFLRKLKVKTKMIWLNWDWTRRLFARNWIWLMNTDKTSRKYCKVNLTMFRQFFRWLNSWRWKKDLLMRGHYWKRNSLCWRGIISSNYWILLGWIWIASMGILIGTVPSKTNKSGNFIQLNYKSRKVLMEEVLLPK